MSGSLANQEQAPNKTRPWRYHVGSQFRLLESGSLGDCGVTGVEWVIPWGAEPPAHTHAREDEAVYVFTGRADFWVEEAKFEAGPGSWVFLPRGLEHRVTVHSRQAHLLVVFSPGGIETFFDALSEPVDEPVPQGGTIRYANLLDMQLITEVARESGIKFTSAKTRQAA